MMYIAAITGVLLFGSVLGSNEDFSYSRQDEWPPLCLTGTEQSPTNIITQDVEFDDNLIDLEMTGWEEEYDGTFLNIGLNVRFLPDSPGQVTTRNHIGLFDLLNCHFHWGRETGEGSGHQIDSDPGELEVHCVHRKRNATDNTVRDYLSVISVIADVDEDAELSGPWLQLNVSKILPFNTSVGVSGFRFDLLLPNNRDYYYYEGSFTSPPCYEIVQWFVMKSRITVPGAYMKELRKLECNNEGDLLGFNFRMPQELGERVVRTNSQAVMVKPLFITLSCLVLLVL
jgi:carbonic anhydrase